MHDMMLIDGPNRTSKLPEAIMHQILSYLPLQDKLRMPILSKTWKRAVNSRLPGCHHESLDSAMPSVLCCQTDRDPKNSKDLVKWIDKSMIGSCTEHGDQKRFIECFIVPWIVQGDSQQEQVEVDGNHMNLITKNCTLNLNFKIYWMPRCNFPPSTFHESLAVLNLCNCVLGETSIRESKVFRFLQVLRLSNVDVNGLVGDLLKKCPYLDTLEIKSSCRNVKFLEIEYSRISRLKNVFLGFEAKGYGYRIESRYLETLHLDEIPEFFEIPIVNGAVSCHCLKELSIRATHHFIDKVINLETAFSRFPLLKELKLFATFDHNKIVKISSRQLEKLSMTLCGTRCLKGIDIDSPKLRHYLLSCTANNMPSSISLNSPKLEVADLEITFSHGMLLGRVWFLKLRNYVSKFAPQKSLNLRIKPHSEMVLCLEELGEDRIGAPLSPLKAVHLKLVDNPSIRVDYKSLIDGLFWCCHPLTLSVKAFYPANTNFMIKALYNHLTCNGENAHFSNGWRRQLKSVKIKSFWGAKYGHEGFYGEHSSENFLFDLEEVKEATFELNWLV